MKACYFSKYEPIFGAWHITEELGFGAEGHLYRIRRTDSLGHVFYSALKAITIPGNGSAELEIMMAGGMTREEAVNYYKGILDDTAQEFAMLEKLKGNSNIVSYEDHEIFQREEGFGWDILIRLEELNPLVKHSIYNPLDEAEVIKMGADICRGLVLCRKYGIVHRDIKPENIFISPSGSYKLGDFGIARVIEGTSDSLSRKGTYSYMAPEVYWGKEYDHSVDQYSLGMVMYRFLNDGRMPFMPVYPEPVEYRDGEVAFSKRMNAHIMPPPRNCSEELSRIVLKACSYDPSDRYADADEMLSDLESLMNGKTGRIKAVMKPAEKSRPANSILRTVCVVLSLCLLTAAAAYYSIPKEVTDITATGLEEGAELYIGESISPEYKAEPYWFYDEPVHFSSSDPEVFTVTEAGSITGVSPGTAVMTMSAREYTEEVDVKVLPKVTSIEGIDDPVSMTTGESLTLKPKLRPKKFSSEPVTYKIKDGSIATVSEKGEIQALSAGETRLTISAGGYSKKVSVEVAEPVQYRTYVSNYGGYSGSSSGSSSGRASSASSGSSGKSSGNSGSKSEKSSGKSSGSKSKAKKGYFDSSDDEHF